MVLSGERGRWGGIVLEGKVQYGISMANWIDKMRIRCGQLLRGVVYDFYVAES